MCDTYTMTIHLKVYEYLHATVWAWASLRVVSWKANTL